MNLKLCVTQCSLVCLLCLSSVLCVEGENFLYNQLSDPKPTKDQKWEGRRNKAVNLEVKGPWVLKVIPLWALTILALSSVAVTAVSCACARSLTAGYSRRKSLGADDEDEKVVTNRRKTRQKKNVRRNLYKQSSSLSSLGEDEVQSRLAEIRRLNKKIDALGRRMKGRKKRCSSRSVALNANEKNVSVESLYGDTSYETITSSTLEDIEKQLKDAKSDLINLISSHGIQDSSIRSGDESTPISEVPSSEKAVRVHSLQMVALDSKLQECAERLKTLNQNESPGGTHHGRSKVFTERETSTKKQKSGKISYDMKMKHQRNEKGRKKGESGKTRSPRRQTNYYDADVESS